MSIFSARPVTVAVTGAAGQIGYALLFRIAAGDLLGPDTHVRLRLLEITPALGAAEGVALELEDCAFPLLSEVDITDSAEAAFDGANVALLVGSRPRTEEMERRDLLQANGAIFVEQGRALSERASDDVRVLVVGNPANTNALIAQRNAPDVPADRFTAMTRLDHNRAKGQLAQRVGASVGDVHRVTIWGNHSLTQVPDLRHATVGHRPAPELLGDGGAAWVAEEFTPVVQRRGAQIIAARGASSAASAANAAVDHVHDWVHGTKDGDWTSAGVVSDGSYGVPEGLVSSFPVTSDGGGWTVVPGLEVDGPTRAAIDASVAELTEERDAVRSLGLI